VRSVALGLLCVISIASSAFAQAAGQAWGNVVVDWLQTNRTSYEVDLEPQGQVFVHEGQPTWGQLKAIPRVTYALSRWVDVLGETEIAYRAQSDEVNSMTLTPRIGAELHILSRILGEPGSHGVDNERVPRRRINFGTLVRLEHVNTMYSTNALATSSWQVRDRFGFTYPFNRAKTTDDGAIYVVSDGEVFIPVDETVKGGAVKELRLRAGFGYRESFSWQYEALYIWNGERNAQSGAMAASFHAIDVRVRRQF
jgi:hypothetical protein